MIYGIDPGMRSLAVVSADEHKKFFIKKPEPRYAELHWLTYELAQYLYQRGDDEPVIFIEEPPYVNNLQTHLKLAMTVGAVFSLGYETHLVSPADWKKVVLGKGNLNKTEVSAWLKTAHPAYYARCAANGRGGSRQATPKVNRSAVDPVIDQDLVDATCIWLYGQALAQSGSAPRS